jgi:hypothetical protein
MKRHVETLIYRVSQEECGKLRESVPYVKVYRYNPKHLYPKLNGYGDKGQRKVGASCASKYRNLHSCALRHVLETGMQSSAVQTADNSEPALRSLDIHAPCKVLGTLKDDCGVNASVYIVQFNGFMSLIR